MLALRPTCSHAVNSTDSLGAFDGSGGAQAKRKNAMCESAGQTALMFRLASAASAAAARSTSNRMSCAPAMLPNQRFNSSRPISVCLGSANDFVAAVVRVKSVVRFPDVALIIDHRHVAGPQVAASRPISNNTLLRCTALPNRTSWITPCSNEGVENSRAVLALP